MQQQESPPPGFRIALQWGIICGLIYGVLSAFVQLINTVAIDPYALSWVSYLLGGVLFVLGLAAYFVAGIIAAQKTGKVRTGTFAGLWAAGAYSVISVIVSLLLFFVVTLPRSIDRYNSGDTTSTLSAASYQNVLVVSIIIAVVFSIVLAFGLGAGLGALGGLLGRATSRFKPVPVVSPYYGYPGQPYPGQPYGGYGFAYPPQNPAQPGQPLPYGPPTNRQDPMQLQANQPLPYGPPTNRQGSVLPQMGQTLPGEQSEQQPAASQYLPDEPVANPSEDIDQSMASLEYKEYR